jgi:hypothetical protein
MRASSELSERGGRTCRARALAGNAGDLRRGNCSG